jgi:glucose/arabinose dehydrogenase
MLYIGFGDGGSADDPHGNGQNLSTLLSKMLRIDVDRRDPGLQYAIPKDNPFVGKAGARPEIWAYGLRNPWRYSFDPRGRLIVADVGQNHEEEIDIVERGANLGWNRREGRHCFPIGQSCDAKGLVDPIFEYGRGDGISVTGGYVYQGKALPELAGKYIFGDYGSGRVWALDLPDTIKPTTAKVLGVWPRTFSTFGRDGSGEIYAGDYASGEIVRMTRR